MKDCALHESTSTRTTRGVGYSLRRLNRSVSPKRRNYETNQGTHMETRQLCLTRFDRIPTRTGKRPSTIRGPLHIQCSGSEDTKYVRGLITEVLTWPHVESTPPVVSSPDLVSIHLKQAQAATPSSAATAVKEFARVYLEVPTIYLTLPLVTAHWAILHGWAEPHYLASHGLIPAGTVLLYTPRDENELEVCHFHFSRAYEFARESVETTYNP
jgi:hypothetical protein